MGKALLILVIGFSTLFSTSILNMSRHTLESVKTFSHHYEYANARNAATSGVYMSLSKLYQAIMNDSLWTTGFTNLTLNDTELNVDIQDDTEDFNLSSMELRIVSTGTYGDISKTIEVLVGIPPDLADLGVYCTDSLDEDIDVTDTLGFENPDLVIQDAPEMLPFDKDGLVAYAMSQDLPSSHVKNGDFVPTTGWPNGSFYYSGTTPNVTWVKGKMTLNGNVKVWGIFVVEGNVELNGGTSVEGVLYLPNPNSIVINGGGNVDDSVVGGIFANGSIYASSNKINLEYYPEYMSKFAEFQQSKIMFIVSWVETPDM